MKGIILAGGEGSRLHPLTISISKQLMPIYDKPLIYFPLCTLMLANIREILCISSPNQINNIKNLLGDGSKWGISIEYKIQEKPNGIAEAFIIGEYFIKNDPVALILGDNIFYGIDLDKILIHNIKTFSGAKIFTYKVKNPKRYGVVEVSKKNKVKSIIEKPEFPKSSDVATGLYFYDNNVVDYAKKIKPSDRGELEITDLNKVYLKKNTLEAIKLQNGTVWLDAGKFDSLLQASQYVQIIQQRQNILIGSPEEIAFKKEWISKSDLKKIINKFPNNEYSNSLKNLL
tara:strand:+ start:2633 stop:3493 length:861 start_codon:yes stop_codon:yes gene_type:complete